MTPGKETGRKHPLCPGHGVEIPDPAGTRRAAQGPTTGVRRLLDQGATNGAPREGRRTLAGRRKRRPAKEDPKGTSPSSAEEGGRVESRRAVTQGRRDVGAPRVTSDKNQGSPVARDGPHRPFASDLCPQPRIPW